MICPGSLVVFDNRRKRQRLDHYIYSAPGNRSALAGVPHPVSTDSTFIILCVIPRTDSDFGSDRVMVVACDGAIGWGWASWFVEVSR